jgi:TRAP-type C4-dicarboxylate transport system permease small subunit
MRGALRKLDERVYRFERGLALVLIAAMSLAVFFDVVHRLASTQGPLDRLTGLFLSGAARLWVSRGLAALLTYALVYAALRTARVKRPPSPARAATLSALIVSGLAAFVLLFVHLMPSGLVWSQVFALCGMLWVGFLGASMATKEGAHLTLEIMEFVWRGKAKAHVGRVGALIAAAFSALMAWLSALHVSFHHATWTESEGSSGLFDAFPAPKFVVYAILPVSFSIITLRFLGRVVGPAEEKGPELPTLRPPQTPGGGPDVGPEGAA